MGFDRTGNSGRAGRHLCASTYAVGGRVFHDKFGYGEVTGIKLTVTFDKAGEKKVLDSFVMAA